MSTIEAKDATGTTDHVEHVTRVDRVRDRYPYRPACSCGWTFWGYVAEHAAQHMADAHAAGKI